MNFALAILILACFLINFAPSANDLASQFSNRDKLQIKQSSTMRKLFAIALSALLLLGFAPVANAAKGAVLNRDRPDTTFPVQNGNAVSGLTPCGENAKFQERASAATATKDIIRFRRYSKAVCGDDGLPHLIVDGRWNHAGEILIPGILFVYITGIIGWSGRSYLIEIRKNKNAWDKEIHIDFTLARKCVIQAAAWPSLADKEWRNGNLLEKDENISFNGPR